jgi:hypothetical protein
MLKNWKGTVEINGTEYENIENAIISGNLEANAQVCIKLAPKKKSENLRTGSEKNADNKQVYRITVKKYMTQKATMQFPFMKERNHDIPMPLCIMTGTIEKETPGMVYMTLHGDMYAETMCTCMKCGKKLTNKVSQYFGIGPECGGHNYVNPFDTEEELKEAVAQYRKKLQQMTWSGWCIKSAIIKWEEI